MGLVVEVMWRLVKLCAIASCLFIQGSTGSFLVFVILSSILM